MNQVVDIALVDPDHEDAKVCLDRYFQELADRFEEGFDASESAAPSLDDFVPPKGIFLVAYFGGRPAGCGGFKQLNPDTAYLKRMWVEPAARGLGIGRKLLTELEKRAVSAGYQFACLDTHRSLAEAKVLYERSGYVACEPLAAERYADHWFIKPLQR